MNLGELELDKDNKEFNQAIKLVENTNHFIYLTGKAGAGKTTFLKYLKENTKKNTVILAPTGVAAINAGGVTIHSFFNLPFGPIPPDDQRLSKQSVKGVSIGSTFKLSRGRIEILERLELLIIDEISMVRCDTLDVIDKILRAYREKEREPFGGVQVLLIGDSFQLPPIVKENEWRILRDFYDNEFFFSSRVMKENAPIYIELKKIYRQKDQDFIDLLNRIRVDKLKEGDIDKLNSRRSDKFLRRYEGFILLATHNKKVEETNRSKLENLDTKLYEYEAKIDGKFPDSMMPTDMNLGFKVGAQVMFIKNDSSPLKEYYNGKIGKISELTKNKIVVEIDDKKVIDVKKAKWENIKYSYDKYEKKIYKEVIGKFEQYPLRLAWAITVHKSQGLTFEKVFADISSSFTDGQVYVALSRCTSFEGLFLSSKINKRAISANKEALAFAQRETPQTTITQQLEKGSAEFFYNKAVQSIREEQAEQAYDYFVDALYVDDVIESPEFKRFFVVKLTRFINAMSSLGSLQKENLKLKEEMNFMRKAFGVRTEFDIIQSKVDEITREHVKELEKRIDKLRRIREKDQALIEKLEDDIEILENKLKG